MSQSVYCTTYWDITEEGNETFVSSYRQGCIIQSDQLGFMQVPDVLSILIGPPLNLTITNRLLQKKLNKLCRYHWFIITQCVSDVAFTLDHLVIAILYTQKCTFAPMLMHMLSLMSCYRLSTFAFVFFQPTGSRYSDRELFSQNAMDSFFYLIIFIAFGLVELGCKLDTIRTLSTYISLLLNCSIIIVIYNVVAVTFWNTSTAVTLSKRAIGKCPPLCSYRPFSSSSSPSSPNSFSLFTTWPVPTRRWKVTSEAGERDRHCGEDNGICSEMWWSIKEPIEKTPKLEVEDQTAPERKRASL